MLSTLFASLVLALQPVDISDFDSALSGAPTEVAILGSTHLGGWTEEFDRPTLDRALDPILDRLEAFAPDVIAIEAVSGADCDHLVRYGEVYAGGANYCRSVEQAEKHLGITAPEAELAIFETFLETGLDKSPAGRRKLAALFLAAGDRNNALVQWLHLAPAERVKGDELNDELVDLLTKLAGSMNENVSIGVALALRLGHERVFPVDDHSADQVQLANAEHYGRVMRSLWAQNVDQADEKRAAANKRVDETKDLLTYYRWINSHEAQHLAMKNDFALALAEDGPEGVGRTYIDWWQVRNLRMTANIMAAIGMEKAKRALAIVGSSHAPYYARYLDMMHDVQLVDAETLLAD